ncbi:helix-turn-helix domain-containing protein [Paraburkholderia caribensis]|uniref:helix-turn-helix domain-containing protein n=1 Tax=Paraburkholderia caribensis TaxID=75105 RepID=UPI001314C5BF
MVPPNVGGSNDAAQFRRELGSVVRVLRAHRKFSQQGLADRSGLTRAFISLLERGESNVSIDSLFSLCAGLSISFTELVMLMRELEEIESQRRRRGRVPKKELARGKLKMRQQPANATGVRKLALLLLKNEA